MNYTMFFVGITFAMIATIAILVGFVMSLFIPIKFICKWQPTLSLKWIFGAFTLYAIALSWMICGLM